MSEKEAPSIEEIRKAYGYKGDPATNPFNKEPAPLDKETQARLGEIAAAIRGNEIIADRRNIEAGMYGDIEGYENHIGNQ